MKRIIFPVPVELIKKELTQDKFIRHSNYGNNQIFSVNSNNSPNIMREIGRLRELAFRNAGGGTGKEFDVDECDYGEKPYQQLIVWDPKRKEILGGYRYILGKEAPVGSDGKVILSTSSLFNFSDKFLTEYIPYTIELGRSFVQPNYQSTNADRKGLFALDNLWDGLGALTIIHPHIKFFFGKVTMYPDFNRKARDMILFFLKKYFSDSENLVTPIIPAKLETSGNEINFFFSSSNYQENYKILSQNVRALGENIPPLINSYMSLSPTMKTFGTAINPHFGEVEETGLIITIKDIYNVKKDRHILSFKLGHRVFRI
ncbi:MAG: hemolysin [Bacteroidetes bacterium CG23_combo_of_CG06-09_8_20_14_all_32_9]|nr:MAG: hemolysin [Bacteroidetes bacterium CG23_combo_of_CG06-09_8_20_14_all_32_9]